MIEVQGGGFEPPKALSHRIAQLFRGVKELKRALESGPFDRFGTPAFLKTHGSKNIIKGFLCDIVQNIAYVPLTQLKKSI